MKIRYLVIFFLILFSFSCKTGNKDMTKNKEDSTKGENEVILIFAVEGDGGKLKAEVDGAEIATNSSINKGKEVLFTAIPNDESWEIDEWKGKMKVSHDKMSARLVIEESQTVTLSFKKMKEPLPKDFVKVPVMSSPIQGIEVEYPLPDTILKWKGVFTNERKLLISPYAIAKYELSYNIWYEVRTWAEERGYKFANKGVEGFDGEIGATPKEQGWPATEISWFDCIVWCNAYTEKLQDSEDECVYRKDGAVLKDATSNACKKAKAHMEKTGFRLPTEAEWEWAARYQGEDATNADKYKDVYLTKLDSASGAKTSCGFEGYLLKSGETWEGLRDETARVANYDNWFNGKAYVKQEGKTRICIKVNEKEPNHLGLYNMSGNISEWCFDFYAEYANEADAIYIGEDGAVINPQGPKKGKEKITRGSCYYADIDYMTVGHRDTLPPQAAKKGICGMRLACSVK